MSILISDILTQEQTLAGVAVSSKKKLLELLFDGQGDLGGGDTVGVTGQFSQLLFDVTLHGFGDVYMVTTDVDIQATLLN